MAGECLTMKKETEYTIKGSDRGKQKRQIGAIMSLIDRLAGTEDPRISSHQFFAALLRLKVGQMTRTELETLFNISNVGTDKTELDNIIASYDSAADKTWWAENLHSIFMLLEHADFSLTKTQINSWVSAAETAP
jgi:hypothetical protein